MQEYNENHAIIHIIIEIILIILLSVAGNDINLANFLTFHLRNDIILT